MGYSREKNKQGGGVGDQLRIYFSEKTLEFLGLPLFYPWKFQMSLDFMEILQNAVSDTPCGNPNVKNQDPW